jgi:hypothetical protein
LSAETWCVRMEGVWHSVLGNYDPDVEGWCPPSVADSSGAEPAHLTQRLCDQRLEAYTELEPRYPDCLFCQLTLQLMEEFATQYPEEKPEETNGIAERAE